jgi:hypothetical protein
MFEERLSPQRTGWTSRTGARLKALQLPGVVGLAAVLAGACSSTPPVHTGSARPQLTSLNSAAGEGYIFPGPTGHISTTYAILQVTGSEAATIEAITVDSQANGQSSGLANSFVSIHDTSAASSTHILSAQSASAATGIGIEAATDLEQAVSNLGSLAAWKTAPIAAGAVLQPGLFYVLTGDFTLPYTVTNWALQSATLTYEFPGGPSQSLSLKIPAVVVSPSASP